MPKKKRTTASGELVLVQSVRRTRSCRMKFCVQGGLGEFPQQAEPGAEWLSWSIACQFTYGVVIDEVDQYSSHCYR